jgi:hypothetical protein
VRRAPGWIRLAGIALELGALAFLASVLMRRARPEERLSKAIDPSTPQGDTAAPTPPEPPSAEPMDFITESADDGARYYRAVAQGLEVLAGFYSDGRVRLADSQNRRFAGMLQGSHADLLEIDTNQWSEVFLRVTPTGRMQLELRGGPYDARVLTCESFDKLSPSTSSALRQAQPFDKLSPSTSSG